MSPAAARETKRGPVPLILLTGFLGAGKTTLLNRVLGYQHHRRVAVLVNELGRIDIDAALIRSRAGDVLELSGGCVCHQIGVQRELWSALDDIVARSRPDVLVLETTGIAEPEAIWTGLEDLARERQDAAGDDDVTVLIEAAATVTVVDAEAGARQLDRHEEARAQVLAADRILLSKIDSASAAHLADLHRRLHAINPTAERVSFPPGNAGTAALVPWFLDTSPGASRRPPVPSASPHEHGGSHHHQLSATTFVDGAPLVGDALLLVCAAWGARLVRAKGFVHVAGESRRGFLERAGDHLSLTWGKPWENETPLTRLVFIGEELDQAAVQRQLWACRAES